MERDNAFHSRRGAWLRNDGGSPSPAPRPTKTKEELDIMYAEADAKREKLARRMAAHERTKNIPRFVKTAPSGTYDNQASFARNLNYTRPRTAPVENNSTITSASSVEAGVARERPAWCDPEIPLNVPKAWLRSKPNPDWIQKILTESGDAIAAEARRDAEATKAEMKEAGLWDGAAEEDNFRQPIAGVPLRSVELGASAQGPTKTTMRPLSPPKTADFRGRSPERSRIWDADVDFTARSLQLDMSPMLRIKPTSRLDEIRERERKDMSASARAVATDRLEEIRDRNSEERALKEGTPALEPVGRIKEEVYYERTILEEEGYPIPGTPITVFPNNSYPQSSSSNHKREDSSETLRKLSRLLSQSPGPSRHRDEERQVHDEREEDEDEKKLTERRAVADTEMTAKVVERSEEKSAVISEPKPDTKTEGKPLEEEVEVPSEKPAGRLLDRISGLSRNYSQSRSRFERRGFPMISQTSRTSSPPKADVDPEERITAEAKLFELQDNLSEKNSVKAPSRSPSPSDNGDLDETPRARPKADPLSLPTPRVTGAFIETPAPSRNAENQRSSSPSRELIDPVADSIAASESKQVGKGNSAAQQVEKPTLRVQDIPQLSTQVPRHTQTQSTSLRREVTTRHLSRVTRPPLVNTAKVSTAAEDLRRLQIEAGIEDSTLDNFETLCQHDAAHKQNMRRNSNLGPAFETLHIDPDVLLSVEEKERQIEALVLARMEQRLRNTSTSIRDAKHGIERLEQQVSAAHDLPPRKPSDESKHHIKIELSVKVPRLWTYDPVAVSDTPPQIRGRFAGFGWTRNWKFTWLGLFLAIFGAWLTAEYAMCEVYCHPVASSKNTWQPSDPFFPWAIPTKLDQWTGEVASSAIYGAKEALDDWFDPEGLRYKRVHYPPAGGGANDWWLGRSAPVGIVASDKESNSMSNDAYD